VGELSQTKLEEFFQVRPAEVQIRARSSICNGPVRTLISDPKHLQIIDILVKKEAILRHAHLKGQGLKCEEAAVEALICALRVCDYDRVPPQALEDIKKVVVAHIEDRNHQTVVQFVERNGEEALQTLEHPHLHRFLYGILQIPCISPRLECMYAEATKEESLGHCRSNLEILRTGLRTLSGLMRPLARFFAAARHLGNAINKDCMNSSAGVSQYGFKLTSLVKLLELKSPTERDASLFHFALLLMPKDEVDQLCEASAVEDLQRARLARSYTVYQVCTQFLDGFRKIQELVRTGAYQGVEIPADKDGAVEVIDLTATSAVTSDSTQVCCTTMAGACFEECSLPKEAQIGDLETRICNRLSGYDVVCVTFLSEDGVEFSKASFLRDNLRITVRAVTAKAGSLSNVFLEKMRLFTDKTLTEAVYVQSLCREVFETYRSFSYYFDDTKCFYPPPSDENQSGQSNEEKKDLFEFCHWILTNIRQAHKEVLDLKLHEALDRIRENLKTLPDKASSTPSAEASRAPVSSVGATCVAPASNVGLQQPSSAQARERSVAEDKPEEIGLPSATSAKPAVAVKPETTAAAVREATQSLLSLKKTVAAAKKTAATALPKTTKDLGLYSDIAKCLEKPHSGATQETPRELSQSSTSLAVQQPPCHQVSQIDEHPSSPMGPPPARKVVQASPHNSPSKMNRSATCLQLPGVARAGTPTPQTNGGDEPLRRYRKSVTDLANKAEKRGIYRVLAEQDGPLHSARDSSRSTNPSRSPSPSVDEEEQYNMEPVVGFTAEIREGARMHRQSRGQHEGPAPGTAEEDTFILPSLRSPRRVRGRSVADYNASKYPLSPVFENGSEAPDSATPMRGRTLGSSPLGSSPL